MWKYRFRDWLTLSMRRQCRGSVKERANLCGRAAQSLKTLMSTWRLPLGYEGTALSSCGKTLRHPSRAIGKVAPLPDLPGIDFGRPPALRDACYLGAPSAPRRLPRTAGLPRLVSC